jgi:hypothetical protein
MIPESSGTYDVRVLAIGLIPKGEPVFSERATRIEIEDEAAGEFVKVTQEGGHTEVAKWITIEPSEWPKLRESIEYMIGQCRSE